VLPAVAASLGARGYADIFGLPRVERACVVVIDGLGLRLLQDHLAEVPTLAALLPGGRSLTAGFPSTTSSSLTSLATGLPPGEHGMLGYRMRVPGTDRLLHTLFWDQPVDPILWQPRETVFEGLAKQGIPGFYVAAALFRDSGLTRATWRGAEYVPATTPGELVAETHRSLRRERRSLVYMYYPELDRTGHTQGCRSPAWRYQLQAVDLMISQLLAGLPEGTLLVLLSDHGMVDVRDSERLNVDAHRPHSDPEAIGLGVGRATPELAAALSEDVRLFSGEDRNRYLHTVPGAAMDVAARWRELVGERAWVVTRDEALEAGWFGPRVRPEFLPRLGDVLVTVHGELAFHGSLSDPRITPLPTGLHGSLTPDEQLVPLLTALV
jgi:hypothetical protein